MKRRLSMNRHPSTAVKPPSFLERVPVATYITTWSANHLNFYRIHMLVFIVVPLIFSGIFYASNGDVKIAYIDCLFMVVSAMTVTGLNSVLLADLTLWQQVILFLMMTLGSTTTVSLITIVIRRQFFRRKFEYLVATSAEARHRVNEVSAEEALNRPTSRNAFGFHKAPHIYPTMDYPAANSDQVHGPKKKKTKKKTKLRADMVRRVDVPVRVNQMNVGGWLKEGGEGEHSPEEEVERNNSGNSGGNGRPRAGTFTNALTSEPEEVPENAIDDDSEEEDLVDRSEPSFPVTAPRHSPAVRAPSQNPLEMQLAGETDGVEDDEEDLVDRSEPSFPITPAQRSSAARADDITPHPKGSIQIDESSKPDRQRQRSVDLGDLRHHHAYQHHGIEPIGPRTDGRDAPISPRIGPMDPPGSPQTKDFPRSRTIDFQDNHGDVRIRRHLTIAGDPDYPGRRPSHGNLREPYNRTLSRTGSMAQDTALTTGFGGFPNPITAAAGYARRRLQPMEKHSTMPRTQTIQSLRRNPTLTAGARGVTYISFDAVVGRNSKFHGLTTAQQEELGGVEYRALTVLLRIVAGYWFFGQMICVLILAPYLTYSKKYSPTFENPPLNPTWFTFFQVFSAWSNNGMSLVDASMVPFQRAYPLIFLMGFLILGGNTAFPIFLRLLIWTISKIVPSRSRVRETLQFLLDHPRRCFIYLFPSHQTWFLVAVLLVLNAVDWVSFLVLDIGNAEIDALPVGVRVADGLLQAFAVRAAGFATVTLANLAPAVQLLYVIMMYIAVYPIAVSIRSTNVYEEKSMGVFEEEEGSNFEEEFEKQKSRSPTEYIAYHARKQLAFDMWWLVLALWLICIIERHNISDPESPWITIFTLIFEVCSSYGTVGLSLGTPTKNTSLAGTLRTLSKLVLCAVMIRGRHRGLPIAIDRAVMVPSDLVKHGDDTAMSFGGNSDYEVSMRKNSEAQTGLAVVEPQTDEERVRQASASAADGTPGLELTGLAAPARTSIEESTSSKEP